MRILITGSTGYLGSRFLERIKSEYPNADIVELTRAKAEKGFFENSSIFSNIDKTFHFAASCRRKVEQDSDIEDLVNSNVLFTAKLMALLSKYSKNSEVYLISSWSQLGIDGRYEPEDLYAATKEAAEVVAAAYAANLKITCYRLPDIYSDYDYRNKVYTMITKDQSLLGEDGCNHFLSKPSQEIRMLHEDDLFDLLLTDDNTDLGIYYKDVYMLGEIYTLKELLKLNPIVENRKTIWGERFKEIPKLSQADIPYYTRKRSVF